MDPVTARDQIKTIELGLQWNKKLAFDVESRKYSAHSSSTVIPKYLCSRPFKLFEEMFREMELQTNLGQALQKHLQCKILKQEPSLNDFQETA